MTSGVGKLVEEIAGINPAVLGEKNIVRAVHERMSACNLANEELYFERARSFLREREALIEAVVVPETSFFRDGGPFTFLGSYVRDDWVPARTGRPLRILSAPCSSGEEPYSIAIVLREAGLKPHDYRIEALDISRALLRTAERAGYTPHSFRGVAESLRDRYFVPQGREYVLSDEVQCRVRFMYGNLLDHNVLKGKKPYDVVFCRNLLIYFGGEARRRLMKTIERVIARGGLLFVGHAETSCFLTSGFVPLDPPGAFGFRKTETSAPAVSGAAAEPSCIAPAQSPVSTAAPDPPRRQQPSAAVSGDSNSDESLDAARRLADQGRLAEAAGICERLLLKDGENPGTYSLLGTVLDGLGNFQRAEECFTRAIYLDAHCYDAVVHLSLLKSHRGDLEGAEVLRRRAMRIQQRTRSL